MWAPPPYIHLVSIWRHSRDKPSPFFSLLFPLHVLYWMPKEKKWERPGNEVEGSMIHNIHHFPVLPPSAPAITMAVSQSPTSINLTWTQPVGEVVDSYEVSFSYQGPCSGFNHTNTTTMAGTTRQYKLTELQEFSNYNVAVVAVNGAGRSERGSLNVVTMADGMSVR